MIKIDLEFDWEWDNHNSMWWCDAGIVYYDNLASAWSGNVDGFAVISEKTSDEAKKKVELIYKDLHA